MISAASTIADSSAQGRLRAQAAIDVFKAICAPLPEL
jgi:hypothetical protein